MIWARQLKLFTKFGLAALALSALAARGNTDLLSGDKKSTPSSLKQRGVPARIIGEVLTKQRTLIEII
jgi:hypothetical protein